MEKEKEMQKKYVQLYLFREQFRALAEEKGSVEKRISETLVSIDTLSRIDSVKNGEEIWTPVGSGAFLRSDIKDTTEVLLGIGAGIVIKKDRKQAVETLRLRLEELVKIDSEMTSELEKFKRQIGMLEEQLRAMVEEKQNG